ncbi:TRAP transporter substrate-binding protein DctP [Marinobacter oulmenensis]|uniref:TRAP-type C4-dicarboxylate transport system substrate-binding protein n=1 Tax=Marinobacter oulmenensis TaxID=643747 RepID=A0A840U7K6_9GAMM|nr:TRAP transporter substrate-binding protein DctP [Marinobacter oulmenensis]MBB5320932.1 TRAP-type C4-dicarboxylate transport system substrate-binding protein [Marinobacter oulmenensis]
MKKHSLAFTAGLSMLFAANASAVQEIKAVHAFPSSLIYSQSFLEFVDKVNEAGEGVVQIRVLGGPEVIGLPQQPDAVRNGVVDMAYTAASFYSGKVPERDALISSNTNAVYARESGGIDLLNQIHQDKMGVYYLGWFDSGVNYNLYTINEPTLNDDGSLDMSGIRLRSNPVYDAFFTDYLKAQPISLPTTDVYSALERSIVDATGWTQIGMQDLNWDKFLNYRIDPAFYSTDMGVIVNLDSWNELTDEAKDILQSVAIEHERSSAESFAEVAAEQQAELEENGMTPVKLSDEAADKYLKAAKEASLNRMRERMEQHPDGLENYDALVELFNDPAAQ